MEPIDSSFEKFKALKIEIESYKSTIKSESDTRLKVVDRILVEVLGYGYADITTEPYSGSGYLDYKVKVDGIGKIIIEAKKDGADFDLQNESSGRAYNLDGALFNSKEMKEGLNQTIYYAAQESVELGCLTNGRTWIIFRANRQADGKKPISGKGIVFSSLDAIAKEFKLFFNLLYRSSVKKLSYRPIFQDVEGQQIRTKDFSKALVTENTLRFQESDFSGDFERVMSTFFSKLSGDDDADFLSQCFVETKESRSAEYQLARISKDLISRVQAIDTSEGEAIQAIIERIKATNRQEFIILVGGKGAGKSTFVDRFFNYVLASNLKDDCIIVKINVGNYKGSETEISKWLDNTLLDKCEQVLYDGAPTNDQIQGIFYGEYNRLKRANNVLYETNKQQFKIDFAKHIESRRETRPTEYIQKLIGNVVKSRKKIPCIIFDNADHFSIEIQEKVFQYGRSIYESEICLVIVPITDKTSWQLSKQGAIRSYENEVLFLPTPSPKKVIEKRIQYLDQKVSFEKVNRGQYFLMKGIQIELQNIEAFVRYLQVVFLHDPLVARWIGAFSNFDIRLSLEITRHIISSPHLSITEFLKLFVTNGGAFSDSEYGVKPYRIKNALVKGKYTSYPINHHPFFQNLYYCAGDVNTSPLLGIRILQLLTDRKSDRAASDSFLSLEQILDYFQTMGIERSVTHNHLQFLLSKGLISSFDPSVTDVDYSKSLEINPSGKEHYYWSLNDSGYALNMMEITPITNQFLFEEISKLFYQHLYKHYLLESFYIYLLSEDLRYCQVPKHVSYRGQLVVTTKIASLKKFVHRLGEEQDKKKW